MKFGEIAKARTALLNAGTTFDRNQLRATLLSHLAKDVETLAQHMATVRADYRRKLERWRTQEVPESVPVCALPSDMHDSRLYRITGCRAYRSAARRRGRFRGLLASASVQASADSRPVRS